MAHFTLTWAGGIMIPGYVPTAAQFNALDANVYAAINGDGGGTYAPSSVITIGGANGLTVSAPLTSSGAFVSSSTASFTGATTRGAASSCAWTDGATQSGTITDSSLSIKGTRSWLTGSTSNFNSGSTLNLKGDVVATSTCVFVLQNGASLGCAAGSALTSGGTVTFQSGCAFEASAGSTCTFKGTFAIDAAATATCAAKVVMSGVGRVVRRRLAAVDADTSITINDGDYLDAASVVFTAPRTYTLGTTNAVTGDVFEATIGTNGTTVLYPLTINGKLLKNQSGAAQYQHARWAFDGSGWIPLTLTPAAP